MNKRFYTLMASIMLAGSAFSTASATDVTPENFKAAIDKNGVLQITKETSSVSAQSGGEVTALVIPDGVIELTGNVNLYSVDEEGKSAQAKTGDAATVRTVTINSLGGNNGLTLTTKKETKSSIEFKGRLKIEVDGVTVDGLKIVNEVQSNDKTETYPGNPTAIVVTANKAIITNNEFVGTVAEDAGGNEAALLNGVILAPSESGAEYTVTGNSFSGFSKSVTDGGEDEKFEGRVWFSTALQTYEGADSNEDGSIAWDKSIIEKNTYSNNDADVYYHVGEEKHLDKHKSTYVQVSGKDNDVAADVLKDALMSSSVERPATIDVTGVDAEAAAKLVQEAVKKGNDAESEKLAAASSIVSVGENEVVVVGTVDPTLIPEGSIVTNVSNSGVSTEPMSWGEYEPVEKSDGTFLLVANTETVSSKTLAAGNYRPGEADAVNFHWTFVAREFDNGTYKLCLQDKDGNFLKVNDEFVYVQNASISEEGEIEEYPTTFTLTIKSGFVTLGTSGLTLATGTATTFGAAQIQEAYLKASDLLDRFGEYFQLEIVYDKDGDNETDLTGVFEGNLKPMSSVWYRNGKAYYQQAPDGAQTFMLVNEDGMILALNTEDDEALSLTKDKEVYPFELITPKQYVEDLLKGSNKVYDVKFSVEYTPGEKPGEVKNVTNILVNGKEVGCWLGKGKAPYLAASNDATVLFDVAIALNPTSEVVAKKWLNKVAYYTVEVINENEKAAHYGKVLGLDKNGNVTYVDPAKTDITKPEGQFAIWFADGKYTFTNRENNDKTFDLTASNLYKINDTEFAYKHNDGFGKYHMDTLAITPITDFSSADGFKRFSETELNANTYTVAMNLLDDSYLYIVENHDDKHRIGLDREEATNWRIEIPTVTLKDATWDDVRLVADTVTVDGIIKYYDADGNERNTEVKASNKKYADEDTYLKICTYILKNTATDEYISGKSDAEEKGNEYYFCPEKDEATRFALKIVGDSTVNLVPVYANGKNWKAGIELTESVWKKYADDLSLSDNKVIGGTTASTGVLKDVNRFDAVSNDLFVISDGVAPTYKSLEQGDKILLSREENNDQVIYEKGEFAAIDNAKAYDINPTVYVDTAYVNREGNYRYDYLLVVNPNRIDKTEECEIPTHEHLRTVITEGRFLINMKDSAEANKNVHNNKYMYDGEYKLSFVPGYHQNDTLYFTDADDKVVSKTAVGNAAHNFAKFAFKMINEENNEFVIETGIGAETQAIKNNRGGWTVTNGTPKTGYLRWHNGNLVVTENLDEAEHFTMEASDKDATANDAIATSEVSVIAGNGFVTVKGAEGKNVVITNVLGQQIANTVVTSSEATIAAPAGVVVVAVEGEAAVKAIVK